VGNGPIFVKNVKYGLIYSIVGQKQAARGVWLNPENAGFG
jgi:hypothetical protein